MCVQWELNKRLESTEISIGLLTTSLRSASERHLDVGEPFDPLSAKSFGSDLTCVVFVLDCHPSWQALPHDGQVSLDSQQ